METPIRYEMMDTEFGGPLMEPDQQGGWVTWEDFLAIKKECGYHEMMYKELQKKVSRLNDRIEELEDAQPRE